MAEGYHAYNEFLVGLSMINQQELMYPYHSGYMLRGEKLVAWSTVSGLWDLGCWSARSRFALSMRLARSKERQRQRESALPCARLLSR
jgi:hypothetical protein